MSEVFNAAEILEIACQIERNGARFYRRAAELVRDPAGAKLLSELAAMEDDHEIAFASMKEHVLTQPGEPGELTDEARLYLRAVADSHVFLVNEDPAAALPEDVGLMDVLRKAMSMEKDSIVYFLGIRDAMPAALGKDKIEAIIQEEMRHVAVISNRMSAIAGSENRP